MNTMADSSDEDVNSDNESIDLKPLWQDRPFIDVRENEAPANSQSVNNNEDEILPRIIELTPTTSSNEELDPLQSLMNEITNMSRRVTNARIARQRILNLGRPTPMEGDNNGTFNPIWRTTPSRCGQNNQNQANESTEDDTRIPYRFSQLRHIVSASGAVASPSPPRWARGRQTFSSVVPTIGRVIDATNTIIKPSRARETRFILPSAIRARERDCTVDDITRADRALFVLDLMLSSLKKRDQFHSIYILQDLTSVTIDSKFNYEKKMSERNLAERISDEETEEFHSAKTTEMSDSSKEYESRVLTDLSSDSDS